MNGVIIRTLMNFYLSYGDNFKIKSPTGSGQLMGLFEVSKAISDRLTRTFLRDEHGRGPVYGGTGRVESDPLWRDNILSYEYFHGDNGAGSGPVTKPSGLDSLPKSLSSKASSIPSECRNWADMLGSLRKPEPMGREE